MRALRLALLVAGAVAAAVVGAAGDGDAAVFEFTLLEDTLSAGGFRWALQQAAEHSGGSAIVQPSRELWENQDSGRRSVGGGEEERSIAR